MDRSGAPASVTVYPDGPLVVRGPVTLRRADGEVIDTGRVVALCRCGRSAVKPFCDGNHRRGAWTCSSAARDVGADRGSDT